MTFVLPAFTNVGVASKVAATTEFSLAPDTSVDIVKAGSELHRIAPLSFGNMPTNVSQYLWFPVEL